MKINLRTVLLLVGVSLIVSGSYASAHTDVTAEQARELIDSTDDLIVIDVREPSEYSDTGGHIPGALNYPWNSGVLQARYEELPTDGLVLVVCASGSRSNRAANFLDSMGFSMVFDMLGGMRNWIWDTVTGDQPESKYGGGTGEPNDPYLIYTAEQLNTIGTESNDWDKHFKLMADIDLSGYSYDRALIAPDTNDAEPDFQGTSFIGVFDGNGCVISNLHVKGNTYLGFFGRIDSGAIITNLGLEAVDVNGIGDYLGGLAGFNDGSIVTSYSIGTVTGEIWIGGLVGINNFLGSITNSYSTGSVSADRYVGGLVGLNFGSITSSYSTNTVIGERTIGGLVGNNSRGSINTSLWDIETSGQIFSEGGIGKTTSEMQTANTFLEAGWDFVGESVNGTEDIWSICEGTNYPRFVWQIATGDFVCPDGITIDDFSFFTEHWLDDNCDLSNGYCQGTDLDHSGTVDVNDLEIFFENWPAER